jgi:hypothetical protein
MGNSENFWLLDSGKVETMSNQLDASLDERGRCCGRKPILYRSNRDHGADMPGIGFHYCTRCDRSYSRGTLMQIADWAWKRNEQGVFVSTKVPFGSVKVRAVRTEEVEL